MDVPSYASGVPQSTGIKDAHQGEQEHEAKEGEVGEGQKQNIREDLYYEKNKIEGQIREGKARKWRNIISQKDCPISILH